MRCIACNEIIDDRFRLISDQEDFCQECMGVITKMIEGIDNDSRLKFVPIEDVEDEI